jgi:glutathionyl-hydroquinone reductase
LVRGLEIFREHFRDYADRYVLIGGAACDIAMTGAGLAFRAAKDLDIVLYVEALDAAFVRAFWEFVRAGGYEVQEKSTGEKQFYRFQKPPNPDYPFVLELFLRQFSAILLDNDY